MRLAAFQQVALRAGHLECLRRTLEFLLEELRHRWRDDTPLYDAFAVPRELAEDDVGKIVAALRGGQTDRVAQSLEENPALAHAKDDDDDQTPLLYLAVDTQDEELVRLLLENGADWRVTTRSGWTVLARACSHSTPAVVDLLLDAGADVNERDCWGTLPLYGSAGNQTMMMHLLKSGAKADAKMAIDMDRLDIADRILTEDSAQARMRFGTGLTLLHDSARVGDARLDAMELLLRHGADINAVTNWEATPLHLAAFHGRVAAVEFLTEQGAVLDIKDAYSLTPLGVAEAKGHGECAESIRRRMEETGQAADASIGFHTIDAGEGFEEATPTDEPAGNMADERTRAIDAFYSSVGRSGDSDPHPMDNISLRPFWDPT
jgi:ankyrin repeat protein